MLKQDVSTISLERPGGGCSLIVSPGCSLLGEVGEADSPGLPGDKSLSHRAALLAAMAEGESLVKNFMVSGVTHAMLEALRALGVSWHLEGTNLTICGEGMQWGSSFRLSRPAEIHCGNSATTMRLLTGALAAWGIPAMLDGTPALRHRPMGRIVEPLRRMGVDILATGECAPLVLQPFRLPLQAIHYTLPVASAQVKGCLLLAALAAEGASTLIEPSLSRDHTERMLCTMGVSVNSSLSFVTGQNVVCLTPTIPLTLKPLHIALPGDFSAAAFLIVAALITPGSQIILRGVGLNPTRTGLLEVLKEMGADIGISNRVERGGEPAGDLEVRSSQLHGVRISGEVVVRMIDEFPALAVAAACAKGTSLVVNAEELRHKESDRISTLGAELVKLGVQFSELEDGFAIHGGRPLNGGVVHSHDDHRLAMCLLVAGLAARSQVTVRDTEIINESFPGFVSVLETLGVDVRRGD